MPFIFRPPLFLACLVFTVVTGNATAAESRPLPSFDFRQAATLADWRAFHDVGELRQSGDGMEIFASGDDPFLVGPAVDLPENVSLALEIRVRSERGGAVEVFYFADHARAGQSVSARVAAGVWEDLRFPLPPLAGKITFRIDPPAVAGGRATVASMALRRRVIFDEPRWPIPPVIDRAPAARRTIRSGALSLAHLGAPGGVEIRVGDRLMAVGLSRSLVGCTAGEQAHWTPLSEAADVRDKAGAMIEISSFADADAATWRVERRYRPGRIDGSIDVETIVSADRDRNLLFFPAFVLLPGVGSFGAAKSQALLCGLEYLGPDDASSSEADVIGPASLRRVPDLLKLTAPLMTLASGGSYLALTWEPHPAVSAFFDSPDRTFGSEGHAMGLLLPGSDGRARIDGHLLPELPHALKANALLTVRATILGGDGNDVVPAVKQYVALRGLPPTPVIGMDAQAYTQWAAGGWLDSQVREGSLVRHAVWPGFGAQPAADAAVWMRWLATQTSDAALRRRLVETSAAVASAVPPGGVDAAAVSHVRYPVASLVLGHTLDNARAAEEQARTLLARFESDGSWRFRRDAKKEDFARTHRGPEANGLTATHVARLLELAAVSGNAELIRSSLRLLRGLDKFDHDVPRGAQSWEIPLHTPDVLASAWLVRAYAMGFELTGEQSFLDKAAYWAWTGVPFIYLRNPAEAAVGPYATIAVYGATNWVEPVWFGRPVQWCGLVYADALYRLAEHESSGPWKQLADGITASGIQQSWPATDRGRQGLLPDFYHLRAQASDGPAINPGTVQANAVRLFGGPMVYDFRRFAETGVFVHAPGRIDRLKDAGGVVAFRVNGWSDAPYEILIGGLRGRPEVRVNGGEELSDDAVSYDASGGRLTVRLTGTATVDLNAITK